MAARAHGRKREKNDRIGGDYDATRNEAESDDLGDCLDESTHLQAIRADTERRHSPARSSR